MKEDSKIRFEVLDINNWNKVPFLKGNIATKKDVDLGRAIFEINSKGQEHLALEIEIPALAYYNDEETNKKTKVIVIQAEQVNKQKVVGLRYFDGSEGVCMLSELEFI